MDLSFLFKQEHHHPTTSQIGLEGETVTKARLLNKDGSFNIDRYNKKGISTTSFYHLCLSTSWSQFLVSLALAYLGINLCFALVYFILGPTSFVGISDPNGFGFFLKCLFFSITTFATIGFGNVYPISIPAELVVVCEAFVGLLCVALVTGLVFSRFARPSAKILFSTSAVIGPHKDGTALMFRVINKRRNELINMSAKVILSRVEQTASGLIRSYDDLVLERSNSMFFPLSWTIVHCIDNDSPLAGETDDTLRAKYAEVLILLSGTDETFSQQVFSASSYRFDEIRWNSRFVSISEEMLDGTIRTDLSRFNETEIVG
jgi:inward rectifier potassium channel